MRFPKKYVYGKTDFSFEIFYLVFKDVNLTIFSNFSVSSQFLFLFLRVVLHTSIATN